MKNLFLTKEEYGNFSKAYPLDTFQGARLNQNGTSIALKEAIAQKSAAQISGEFKCELAHHGLYIRTENETDSAQCCQEAAAVLQTSSINWNILALARQESGDEQPAILRPLKRTVVLNAGKKAGFSRIDGVARYLLQAFLGIAGIVIAAMLGIKGFYSAPVAFDWRLLLTQAHSLEFLALAALFCAVGLWLGDRLWKAIVVRNAGLMSQLYRHLQEKTGPETRSGLVQFLSKKLLGAGMPMAVICEDISSLDSLSREVLTTMISSKQPIGRVVWIIFDFNGRGQSKESDRRNTTATAFEELCSNYTLTRGVVRQ